MNENIWEKNIEALDSRYEKLKNALVSDKNEFCETDLFEIGVEEVADKMVLFGIRDGITYQLDSLYDSKKIWDLWIENQTTLGYMAKCIFCGLGNGMFIKELLKKTDSTVKILVYEPSLSIFIKVCESFDISTLISSERVTLIISDLFETPFKEYIYQFVDFRDLEKLIYQSYPNYDKLMYEKVKECDNEIQLMYNTIRATQGVMARYGNEYYYNSIANSAWMERSKSLVSLFEKIPKITPVFVIASGPSLDKNIKELLRAKGKSFIIAADSAVRALLKNGVIPDMLVTVDGNKSSLHFAMSESKRIPMVCELTSNRGIVKENISEQFFINDLNPYVNEFLAERNILLPVFSSGGSVANTAFAIATSMGFKTIVLVGQDLAYTDDKTHSSQTVRGEENIKVDELEGFYVEGYNGSKVKTSYEFELYLRWFEEQIEQRTDIHVVNATEGGVKIKGTVQETLKSAIDNLCIKEVDIGKIMKDTEDLFTDEQKNEFRIYMYHLKEEFEELLFAANKGIREYKKVKQFVTTDKEISGEVRRLIRATGEITNKIEKNPAIYYIQNKMQEETSKFLKTVYEVGKTPQDELLLASNQGIEYLSIIKEQLEKSIPEIKVILDKYVDIYEKNHENEMV